LLRSSTLLIVEEQSVTTSAVPCGCGCAASGRCTSTPTPTRSRARGRRALVERLTAAGR